MGAELSAPDLRARCESRQTKTSRAVYRVLAALLAVEAAYAMYFIVVLFIPWAEVTAEISGEAPPDVLDRVVPVFLPSVYLGLALIAATLIWQRANASNLRWDVGRFAILAVLLLHVGWGAGSGLEIIIAPSRFVLETMAFFTFFLGVALTCIWLLWFERTSSRPPRPRQNAR